MAVTVTDKGNYFSTRNLLLLLALLQILIITAYFNFTSLSDIVPGFISTSLDYDGEGQDGSLRNVVHIYSETNAQYKKLVHNHSTHTDIIIRYPEKETQQTPQLTSVAVGLAITGKGWKRAKGVPPTSELKSHFVFFSSLLPTFCKTASLGYSYTFYLAFDDTDVFFSKHSNLEQFRNLFVSITGNSQLSGVDLVFINCSHHLKPAWAQNDAMMTAYMDHSEYYYRINDDTSMTTNGWTEAFIKQLQQYDPPNVGVVGPKHKGGNIAILTYDFVHRTHVDLMGFYYPRAFIDWHGDRWITDLYIPGRSTKMANVTLIHTMRKGTRYRVHRVKEPLVREIIERHKQQMLTGMELLLNNITADPHKVISMALTGTSNAEVFGAVRNAVLRQMYFPEWTMYIFVEKRAQNNETGGVQLADRVFRKLENLKVNVIPVNSSECGLPPELWPVLAASNSEVDYFIVRNPTQRLNKRDAAAVGAWIASGKSLHCIRDHPLQRNMAIVPDLWGVKNKDFRKYFNFSEDSMTLCHRNTNISMFSLDKLWSAMKHDSIVHDSVSCDKGTDMVPFPVEREAGEYLGQTFGAFGEYETSVNITEKDCHR